MARIVAAFLDFTVQLLRLLLSICVPCVIQAFEKRGHIIVAYQDINLLFKGLVILICVPSLAASAVICIVYVCSVVGPALPGTSTPAGYQYFAECDIDPEQAAGERTHGLRGARPRTDSHNHRLRSTFRFRCALKRCLDRRLQSLQQTLQTLPHMMCSI